MPNFLASWQPSERRDAGAAERTGLETGVGATPPGVQIPSLRQNSITYTSLSQ